MLYKGEGTLGTKERVHWAQRRGYTGHPNLVTGEQDKLPGRTALSSDLKEDQELLRQGGEDLLEGGESKREDPRAKKSSPCEV